MFQLQVGACVGRNGRGFTTKIQRFGAKKQLTLYRVGLRRFTCYLVAFESSQIVVVGDFSPFLEESLVVAVVFLVVHTYISPVECRVCLYALYGHSEILPTVRRGECLPKCGATGYIVCPYVGCRGLVCFRVHLYRSVYGYGCRLFPYYQRTVRFVFLRTYYYLACLLLSLAADDTFLYRQSFACRYYGSEVGLVHQLGDGSVFVEHEVLDGVLSAVGSGSEYHVFCVCRYTGFRPVRLRTPVGTAATYPVVTRAYLYLYLPTARRGPERYDVVLLGAYICTAFGEVVGVRIFDSTRSRLCYLYSADVVEDYVIVKFRYRREYLCYRVVYVDTRCLAELETSGNLSFRFLRAVFIYEVCRIYIDR